ncbi:MAG: DUF3467 domain-containing protein [Prolixibacteraceae bacterium]
MEDNNKNKNQLNIELSEEVAQGTYSNLAIITHSTSEFVIDFVRIMPGIPKANVKSRIILTPEHAKRLLLALDDNVKKFEKMNGTIHLHGGHDPMMPPMTFGGPAAEA